MRDHALVEARAELMTFEDQIIGLSESVNILDTEKNEAIKHVLSKLHKTEKTLENTVIEVSEEIFNKRGQIKEKMEKRSVEMLEKQEEIDVVLQRNTEIEEDIRDWQEYVNRGKK